jgi:putative ABC transport system permease protein
MKPTIPLWLYWLWLRKWPIQEALAGVGIATGVALVFAVQVANTSVIGSVQQLVDGVTGSAKYSLVARDQQGFDQRLLSEVKAQPDVRAAAPLLMARASIAGPNAHTTVELVGVTLDFATLSGRLVRSFGGLYGVRLSNSLLLPEAVAAQLGVGAGDQLRLSVFGRKQTVRVAAVVGHRQVGVLADSPVVVGPMSYVQQLTGMEGRVTHVLVAPRAGRDQAAHAELTTVAAGRLDVVPSDNDSRLVEQAAGPVEQSTGMFALISVLVGVLFATNAMLLTAPERRRFVSELRLQGFSRMQVTTILLFGALVLGAVASLIGLLLGDQLSRHVFHAVPGYLSFAFPIGHGRIVTFTDEVLAFAAGIGATLLATARPLADVIPRTPSDAAYRTTEEPGEGIPARAQRWMLALAPVLIAYAAAVLVIRPSWAHTGILALAGAMVLVLPSVLTGTLQLADRLSLRVRGGLLAIAVSELRAGTTRAIALAATGALAVFGSVSIEGAHRDLLRGLDANQAAYVGTADVWVSAGGDENSLTTTPFAVPPSLRVLARSGAIADARPYRGGFLDLAGRRVWLIARDPSEQTPIPAGQLVSGDLAGATAQLRAGGAAVASVGLAKHLGVSVGDRLRLPTPSGAVAVRLAATTTNLGWSPGSILLSGADYRRWWGTSQVSAVEVDLNPGTSPEAGRELVHSALGPGSALTVETAAQRLDRLKRLSREGLDRLSQISTLMLVAAAISMAAAMGAAVWQQRRRLAVLRMQGFETRQVWRVLLLQSALVLTVGAVLGAAFGLAGQVLATRWTGLTTGFPTIFSPALLLAGLTLAGVALVALVIASLPGYAASRVSPTVSFQNQ